MPKKNINNELLGVIFVMLVIQVFLNQILKLNPFVSLIFVLLIFVLYANARGWF